MRKAIKALTCSCFPFKTPFLVFSTGEWVFAIVASCNIYFLNFYSESHKIVLCIPYSFNTYKSELENSHTHEINVYVLLLFIFCSYLMMFTGVSLR